MSNNKNILKHKHTVGIILGFVAAFVVLTSESFYYNYLASYEVEVKTDVDQNNDDGDSGHEILTISKGAVSSAAQVAFVQVLHFISNIYIENIDVQEIVYAHEPDFNTYFKTLFRLIISPNAP